MKIINSFKSHKIFAITQLALLIVPFGCESCFKSEANMPPKLISCTTYNNQEDLCNAALQKDSRHCRYDKETSFCVAQPALPPPDCEKLSMGDCRASKYCTYQDANNVCREADPAMVGKCEVIQAEEACTADPVCIWNVSASLCQDKP